MSYSIPHHASNSGSGTTASVTITSPTSGNLLVVFGWTTATFGVSPTGWTNQAAVSGTLGHKNFFKISDGTETSFSISVGSSLPWSLCYIEVSGFTAGSTPTIDQWSWNTSSTSGPTLSNSAVNNGTAGSVNPSCPTAQANEIGLSGAGWDPPEFGEYGWIDGVRIRIVRGAHSGGKSAGTFGEGGWGVGTAYTSIDTNTAQVNAAANSSYSGATPLASSTDVSTFTSGVLFTYSISGPATVSVLSFYGLITAGPSTPIQVINAAIKRASTF